MSNNKRATGYETVVVGNGSQQLSPLTVEAIAETDDPDPAITSWGPRTAGGVSWATIKRLYLNIGGYQSDTPDDDVVPGEYSARSDVADWYQWHTPDALLVRYLQLGMPERDRFLQVMEWCLGVQPRQAFESGIPVELKERLREARREARVEANGLLEQIRGQEDHIRVLNLELAKTQAEARRADHEGELRRRMEDTLQEVRDCIESGDFKALFGLRTSMDSVLEDAEGLER